MDVPDEAIRAAEHAAFIAVGNQAPEIEAAVEAAAPHIDRAARLDELNLLLEDWPNLRADTLRERIAELRADQP